MLGRQILSHPENIECISILRKPLTPMRPLGPASIASGGAATATGVKGDAAFKIMSINRSQVPEPFIDEKGQHITMMYLRVQFKITDSSVNSLDTAIIYLFNQKKELVGSLSEYSPQAKISGTNIRENILNYPNMLSALTGLEKNKAYNLIFMYRLNEVQYRYAVAVLGTKDKVVADTYPGSAKVDEFTFDGKDKLVQ